VKKSVRFAEELDVQPSTISTPPPKAEPVAAPLSDSVLERSSTSQEAATTSDVKPQKVSRFKLDRMVPSTDATPPKIEQTAEEKDQVLLDRVMERPSVESSAAAPEVNEFDPELQQRQLASEYYRMRNNMIRQQGGFKPTAEDLDQPLMEERDGKVKKLSRFKAARMQY